MRKKISNTSVPPSEELLGGGNVGEIWLGEILLTRPLSFTFFVAFFLGSALVLLCFFILGEYTEKETVTGHIAIAQGLAKVPSSVSGVVIKRLVADGDKVVKGQALFVISTERSSSIKGDAQTAILEQLTARKKSLQEQHRIETLVRKEDELALRQRFLDLQSEIQQMEHEIDAQKERLSLNTINLEKFKVLAQEDVISESELHEREQENLSLRAQLESLRRVRISLQKDAFSARTELRNAPFNASNALAGLDREIAGIEQQSIDNEINREVMITAPIDGIATAVLVDSGQDVKANALLLAIVPDGSVFEAQLFVPSRASGFLKVGGEITLRYQAFPYQKFGEYTGSIKEISRTALSSTELHLGGGMRETYYRVTVSLDSQVVTAYGKSQNLQDGMELEADLLLDTRRLYEWVLEPLYRISG